MNIYLDNHATTPVDPAVFEEMAPYFLKHFGNAASKTHEFGWRAEEAVNHARKQVAKLIKARPNEVIFTSGATESINIALFGTLLYQEKSFTDVKPHLITTIVEHKATLEVCGALEKKRFSVTYLPVNSAGLVDLEDLKNAIRPETVLISIIHANNEIGSINPIKEISQIANDNDIFLHLDAAQSIGKLNIDVKELEISLLSLSGHKIYAPKGIGALYIRSSKPRVRLTPTCFGAGQERGLSPGTLNVPAIVALGKACEIYETCQEQEAVNTLKLKNKLWSLLKSEFPSLILNGHPEKRLSGNLNFSIPNVHPDILMTRLRGLAVSTGAACSLSENKSSHVLQSIGVREDLLRSTLRIGIGRFNTEEDIINSFAILKNAIDKSQKDV